jgi:hypothetical protein
MQPGLAALTVAAIVCGGVVIAGGCSSTGKPNQPSSLVYVGSSDDTWTAMHIVLIDLDYTVESEHRDEGRIRAIREADGDRPASVLTVNQVARHETISLYVRAAAAPGEPELSAGERQRLAQEFLAPVEGLLYK